MTKSTKTFKRASENMSKKLKTAFIIGATALLSMGNVQEAHSQSILSRIADRIEKFTDPIADINYGFYEFYKGIDIAKRRVNKLSDNIDRGKEGIQKITATNQVDDATNYGMQNDVYYQSPKDYNEKAYQRVRQKLNPESSNNSHSKATPKSSSRNVDDLTARLENVMRGGGR